MDETVDGPDVIEWLGVRYRTLVSAKETGGAISVVDTLSPPGSGPPRHVHHREDETFVMLTGLCEIWRAGETTRHGPGDTVRVPRGIEHTFRIVGGAPSRHLILLTPGGFEGFFTEMAAGALRFPEDMSCIARIAARHALEFTGPPLAGQGGRPATLGG